MLFPFQDILLTNDAPLLDPNNEALSNNNIDLNLRKDIDLLHRRLAHTDVNMLLRMVRSNTADGLLAAPHVLNKNKFHCDACSLAKAVQRDRYPSLGLKRSFERVNKDLYFTVVWSDVLGPIQPVALGGFKYAVTFTESNSRYRYFYPLVSRRI